jgi:hypothetical protein
MLSWPLQAPRLAFKSSLRKDSTGRRLNFPIEKAVPVSAVARKHPDETMCDGCYDSRQY